MLDEKGRLFGKINIVDLLIVLVIIAAVAFVGIKYVMPAEEAVQSGEDVQMKIYVANTHYFVADALEKGVKVWDYSSENVLGTLADWTISPYYEYSINKAGETITYENPELCIVEVTIDAKGTMGDFGLTIDDTLYGIGHSLVFYCGEAKLYGAVSGLEVVK